MERRAYEAPLDPALAVSGLLTRIGLFLLVIFAPLMAMFSRHTVAILIPVATCLLILAAALDGRLPDALRRMGRSLFSLKTMALLAIMLWAAVTIVWTPNPASAMGRLPNLVAIVIVFIATIACLTGPMRVRASDVNLIPVGVAIAALALAVEALPHSPLARWADHTIGDAESLRAAMLLVLLVWPAAGALQARSRNGQALALYAITILALWLVRELIVLAAFIGGALTMILALRRPRFTSRLLCAAVLALLFLSPAIGWIMVRYGGFLLPAEGDHIVAVWRDVTYAIPSHFWGGFGYDSSAWLTRGAGGQVLASPRNAALQIWLELGFIGVLVSAGAVLAAFGSMQRQEDRSTPASLAAGATATIMMFSGLAAWQAWWLMFLGLTSVSLTFLARLGARPGARQRR